MGDNSSFRLGFVPGTTPGKWARRWADRFPHHPLELVPVPFAEVGGALATNRIDAALSYLPVNKDLYHAIPLYREDATVVVPKEHLFAALTDGETVADTDLADETIFIPPDSIVLIGIGEPLGRPLSVYDTEGKIVPDEPPPAPQDATEAVAWVAAEVGLTVLPFSLARLHRRKDVTFRKLTGVAGPEVGLVWLQSHDSPIHQELAGIVRGRSARSSRGLGAENPSGQGGPAAKQSPKAPANSQTMQTKASSANKSNKASTSKTPRSAKKSTAGKQAKHRR